MKLKRYNQLFEADIKKNKGIPSDYIEGVEQKGREQFGYNGPGHGEMMQMMDAIRNIMRIQNGHEDELTEIGKGVIMDHYGDILQDVKLDIKIVKPNDPEKLEMTQRMFDENDNVQAEPEEDEEVTIPTVELDLPKDELSEEELDEVDKRNILNNLMQGEAQNVHSMIYEVKDDVDAINPSLVDRYITLLTINRKFDWMDSADLESMMKQNPEMCNCEEVNWEEDENGDTTPVIKVRALDLPMIIHETVKGIYELIMANAIPESEYLANRIMAETDSLKDEKQDIKFGPFIAADLRDFITGHLDRNHKGAIDMVNIKEFIFSKMVELEAKQFLELIYTMLSDDTELADDLLNKTGIVEESISDINDNDEDFVELEAEPEIVDDEMLNPKEKSYADMSKSELDKELNNALEIEDYETVKKIQPYL